MPTKTLFFNNLLYLQITYSLGIQFRILSSNHLFFGNTISCFTFKSSILWEYNFVFYLQIIFSLGIQFRVLPSNHLFFGHTISCFPLKSSFLWEYNFVFSFEIIYSLGIQFRVFSLSGFQAHNSWISTHLTKKRPHQFK